MKTKQSKTGMSIVLLLVFSGVLAFGQTAEKVIQKDYKISKGYTLNIDNRYGAIEIVNWDQNNLSVEVKIETKSETESKANKLLEKATIDISEEKSAVYFDTDIDLKYMNENNYIKVTYTVKTPAWLNVNLEQKYGNIYIQEITGEANIELKYGDLVAQSLLREQDEKWNSLEIANGKVKIGQTGRLSAEIEYGVLELENSTELSIESAFTELILGDVGILSLESRYDHVKMTNLFHSAEIEAHYTQVNLGRISDDFKDIDAEMSFGNLSMEMAPGASFEIDAETNFGSINLEGSDIQMSGEINMDNEGIIQELNGTVGTSPKASLSVEIRYGDLNLN